MMRAQLSRLATIARPVSLAVLAVIPAAGAAGPVEIENRPFSLEAVAPGSGQAVVSSDPDVTLTLTGAWRLASADPRFGGFSAILPQDDDLLLVSDRGSVLRMPGAATAIPARGSFLELPEACLAAGKWGIGDAEAVALSPDGSEILIAMEQTNTVCAFDPRNPQAGRLLRPGAISRWKRNRGAEAMATLAGEGTAIIGEARQAGGRGRPLLWFGEGLQGDARSWHAMRYLPRKGYKPAGAAFLPDGRLLVLDRASGLLRGRPGRLTLVDRLDPEADSQVVSRHLADVGVGGFAASYEGIAVAPGKDGSHVVWLVSDDNFAARKGTILLRLELRDKPGQSTVIAGRASQGSGLGKAEP